MYIICSPIFHYVQAITERRNYAGIKVHVFVNLSSLSAETNQDRDYVLTDISFYVPKKNQPNPPPAEGLHVQKWGIKYAAVRQFGGFVLDDRIGEEASALYSSLAGSNWASLVDKGRKADLNSVYTVVRYNSPFEFTGRVNEIWMMFEMKDSYAS